MEIQFLDTLCNITTFKAQQEKLTENITKAKVTKPSGKWIVYEKENFNSTDDKSKSTSTVHEEILTSKTLTNSGLTMSRFDKIKVEELLGAPRRLLNVFQFN